MELRTISAVETHPLRQLVLRPGQPASTCLWPGDDAAGSIHLAAVVDGVIVSIASILPEALPPVCGTAVAEASRSAVRAYRLRGMATHPARRRQGYGTALLDECLRRARDLGADWLWCNARTPAIPFYRRAGLAEVGEEFEPPGLGPHRVMWIDLRPA